MDIGGQGFGGGLVIALISFFNGTKYAPLPHLLLLLSYKGVKIYYHGPTNTIDTGVAGHTGILD